MKTISIVVPIYNEAEGLLAFHDAINKTLHQVNKDYYNFTIIYVNDGSSDGTINILKAISKKDNRVHVVSLSRNFGKEAALAAGIANAAGSATLILDSDGQHPVDMISDFIKAWENGAKVVVGVRNNNASDTTIKRLGSRMFYKVFNRLSNRRIVPGSTDYRLIDESVRSAFVQLKESNRITRGLIDWLGFEQSYVYFEAPVRQFGTAKYSSSKLFKLASDSIVSLSAIPLYLSLSLGIIITPLSLILGITVFVEQIILGDPLSWDFTGTAMLAIIILFLIGIVLVCLGILSVYISHIHGQSQQRPLYIIDAENSIRLKDKQ